MDTLTVAQRSQRMALIRSKDTAPELVVRRSLHRLGYRYRLHRRDLPGVPDLAFPSRKKVVFVHGCFWHAHDGCKVSNIPKTQRSFWVAKFDRNKAKDHVNQQLLKELGWDVLIIWECETKDKALLESRITSYLGPVRAMAIGGPSRGRQ